MKQRRGPGGRANRRKSTLRKWRGDVADEVGGWVAGCSYARTLCGDRDRGQEKTRASNAKSEGIQKVPRIECQNLNTDLNCC